MATEIAYKVSVETGEGGKSLKSLKQDFKDAQKELDGLEQGTLQYVKALEKLGAIRDNIGDLNAEINAFNPEGKVKAFGSVISGLASGFQAAQGAAALFGGESKEVEKALLKVQGAMALSEGIKGIIGLGDGFRNLSKIIKASFATNPLGVILLAVTALGTALAALYYSLDKSSEATRDLNKEAEKQKEISDTLSKSTKRQVDLLTAQGASEEVIVATKKKLIQQQILEIEVGIKLHQSKLRDILDNDNVIEGIYGVQKALFEKLGMTKEAEAFDKMIQGSKAERAKEDLDAIKKEKEDLLDLKNNILVIDAEVTVKKKEEAVKQKEITDKNLADDWAAAEAYTDKYSAEQAKIVEIDLKNRLQKEQDDQDGLDAWQKLQQEIADAEYAAATQSAKDRIELEKQKQDAIVKIIQDGLNSAQALADIAFVFKLNSVKKGSKEEEKIAKQQFEVNKALQIANTIVNTIVGVRNALIPKPAESPLEMGLRIANAVSIGIGGVAAIAKIAATKFGSTGGNVGGLNGGGGGGGGATAPAIAPPSNGSTMLNPDGSVKAPTNQQPVIKAVVVETDITKTQRNINSIETSARL